MTRIFTALDTNDSKKESRSFQSEMPRIKKPLSFILILYLSVLAAHDRIVDALCRLVIAASDDILHAEHS